MPIYKIAHIIQSSSQLDPPYSDIKDIQEMVRGIVSHCRDGSYSKDNIDALPTEERTAYAMCMLPAMSLQNTVEFVSAELLREVEALQNGPAIAFPHLHDQAPVHDQASVPDPARSVEILKVGGNSQNGVLKSNWKSPYCRSGKS